ncbi:hypothetical protein P9112_012242 [Eukaryota sp. TZLM1-RC]
MKLSLLAFFVLVVSCCAASLQYSNDDYGHTFLEYGVPIPGSFSRDNARGFYYIDVAQHEKLIVAIDAELPVRILLSQDPYPAAWNASWSGTNLFTMSPGDKGYFPGRFYIALVATGEMDMDYTVSGYAFVPMIEEIPTASDINDDGRLFFGYPVCQPGLFNLMVVVDEMSHIDGIYLSQTYAHPTEENYSWKLEDGEDEFSYDLRSPGTMYIGIKGKSGEMVTLIGNMENEIEEIEQFKEISGSVFQGCVRHYAFHGIDDSSSIPLTIIASESYENREAQLYLSHGTHNIFPGPEDYDDVSYMEIGSTLHFNALEFIDGEAFFGIESTMASLWVPTQYSFMVSQKHTFIHEGYESVVTIPSSREGGLFVFSRIAEQPVRFIAAEVVFSDARERDATNYLFMGHHEDPLVEESQCATSWGYVECHESFEMGQHVRYFMKIIPKDDAAGAPPSDINLLVSFVYDIDLYETLHGHLEKDEYETFAIDFPAHMTSYDAHILATTDGDGYLDLFASTERIPTSHRNFHEWRGVGAGYSREIIISKDEFDFGEDATIYFSVRGTSKCKFKVTVFTDRHTPLKPGVGFKHFLQPNAIEHYFFPPEADWHSDGVTMTFGLHAPEDSPLALYISSHDENPDEENYDWMVTPTSGAVIVDADDYSYRHDLGSYYMTVMNLGNDSELLEYTVIANSISPMTDDRPYIDFVPPTSQNMYMFRSDAHDADHFIEVTAIKPIGTVDGHGSLNVFVSSTDIPGPHNYEFALKDLHYDDGTKFITILHEDAIRGSEVRGAAGTFLMTVKGHDNFNMFEVAHYTSIHLPFDSRLPYSVFHNERRHFNIRIDTELYSTMKKNGFIDIALSPAGDSSYDCLSGLTIWASDSNVHPDDWNHVWGGELQTSIRIMGDDMNLHVGRIYLTIFGETNGCSFTINAYRSLGHYTAGTIFGWIFLFVFLTGAIGGGAYAFVFFKKNPQRIPKWVPARFRTTQYDSL